MPLARPHSSKPSTRQFPIISMVEGWQGSEYRTSTAIGHVIHVSTPRVHCCTFHSIGSVIKFLAFVANRATSIPEPKLPDARIALRQPPPTLSGGVSGMPNLRWFRSNQRVSIPIPCFHGIAVHIERENCVPDSSRAKSSDNRVPSNSCRRHLLWL